MNKKISFVLPCLNEERGIGKCLDKINDLIARGFASAEVIVVDNNSTDNSVAIAREKNARVVVEHERGYGAAYLRGIAAANGEYIVMADADNSYDFMETPGFIQALDAGFEFVIGSRFKGRMHKNAMPFLNRYLGNPVLSGMMRFFLKTTVNDIHCGFRAFTKEAYQRMNLKSKGMEFASEMVVAAIREHLRIREVPISYYPREGVSKLSRWKDAWRHIKCMLLFSPTWLYMIPGLSTFVFSFLMVLLLLRGPLNVGMHTMDVHFMVLFSFTTLLGFQLMALGYFAKMYGVQQGFFKEDGFLRIFERFFTPDKGIFTGGAIFAAGCLINVWILVQWIAVRFGEFHMVREALFALTVSIIGIQLIFSSFFSDLLYFSNPRR